MVLCRLIYDTLSSKYVDFDREHLMLLYNQRFNRDWTSDTPRNKNNTFFLNLKLSPDKVQQN